LGPRLELSRDLVLQCAVGVRNQSIVDGSEKELSAHATCGSEDLVPCHESRVCSGQISVGNEDP
jgi:hypothetical protein